VVIGSKEVPETKENWPIGRWSQIQLKVELEWRMTFSGVLGHVALVRTDVLEELSASFIRVRKIGELGRSLDVTSRSRNEEGITS
jgi:hypothetical protein